MCCRDEDLDGGAGAGAVVTEVAKESARDILVFLFSVISPIDGLPLFNLSACHQHTIFRGSPSGRLNGLTGDRRR